MPGERPEGDPGSRIYGEILAFSLDLTIRAAVATVHLALSGAADSSLRRALRNSRWGVRCRANEQASHGPAHSAAIYHDAAELITLADASAAIFF